MAKILGFVVVLMSMACVWQSFNLLKVDKIAQSYQRDNVKLIRSKVELTKEVVQLRDSLNHCGFYVTEIDPDSLHIQKQ